MNCFPTDIWLLDVSVFDWVQYTIVSRSTEQVKPIEMKGYSLTLWCEEIKTTGDQYSTAAVNLTEG